MVVFYGSQTGTAEEFAARLGKIKIFRQNASRHQFNSEVWKSEWKFDFT